MQCDLKNLPLGLPLTVASVGTIATKKKKKNLHAGFGIAWAALTFFHGWQHHKKMRADACRLFGCNTKAGEKTADMLTALRDSFQVDAYVPGRVRLRSSLLAVNPQWQQSLEEYIQSFTGVNSAAINTLTGSLLITYDVETLRQKPKLAALEQQIAELAAKRI